MRKVIIRIVYTIAVFFIALFIFEALLNNESKNLTADMEESSYPIVTMESSDRAINTLWGFRSERDYSGTSTVITPIAEDRILDFNILTYGSEVTDLSYEVRSLDGERLIENHTLNREEFSEGEDGSIHVEVTLENLIEEDEEYMFILLLGEKGGETVRYYSRIVEKSPEELELIEKSEDIVLQFHDNAIAKKRPILDAYLTTDYAQENDDYSHITINSSTSEAMYGDLETAEELSPILEIQDLDDNTATFRLNYILSMNVEDVKTEYDCTEIFKTRMQTYRTDLLSYDRTMRQIYVPKSETAIEENCLMLGITRDVELKESSGGTALAFVDDGRLYGSVPGSGQISTIFTFSEEENLNFRQMNWDKDIRILSVDENGNVEFAVYGYMSRGTHEGEVGVSVYKYNNAYRTIDEEVFLPYSKSADHLVSQVGKLCFYNKNLLTILIDDTIYQVDVQNRKAKILETGLSDGSFKIAEDGSVLAVEGEDIGGGIRLYNLQTGTVNEIEGESGEKLVPLGFMGTDLIYGVQRDKDKGFDETGRLYEPMYRVKIVDTSLNELDGYAIEDFYVTDCTINGNQITLTRVEKDADSGLYKEAAPDQILNNRESSESSLLSSEYTDEYQTIWKIAVQDLPDRNLTYIEPKVVLHEEDRTLKLPD